MLGLARDNAGHCVICSYALGQLQVSLNPALTAHVLLHVISWSHSESTEDRGRVWSDGDIRVLI